jgi:hypothetical protein
MATDKRYFSGALLQALLGEKLPAGAAKTTSVKVFVQDKIGNYCLEDGEFVWKNSKGKKEKEHDIASDVAVLKEVIVESKDGKPTVYHNYEEFINWLNKSENKPQVPGGGPAGEKK